MSKQKADKRLKIAAEAIIDNIVCSRTDGWAYFRIRNDVFDFLSAGQKVSMALQNVNAFNSLMGDRARPLDCELIISSTPIDVDLWEAQVRNTMENWTSIEEPPGRAAFLRGQYEHLRQKEYHERVTYIGVHLGARGSVNIEDFNLLESGLKGAKETVQAWFSRLTPGASGMVTADEEKSLRGREEEIYRILSTGHFQAERVTAEELLLLIKRQFYPSMPSPYLSIDHENRMGPGDINLEVGAESSVTNGYRFLKFSQMIEGVEMEGIAR